MVSDRIERDNKLMLTEASVCALSLYLLAFLEHQKKSMYVYNRYGF